MTILLDIINNPVLLESLQYYDPMIMSENTLEVLLVIGGLALFAGLIWLVIAFWPFFMWVGIICLIIAFPLGMLVLLIYLVFFRD